MATVNNKATRNKRRKSTGWDNEWRASKYVTTVVMDKDLAAQARQLLASVAKPGARQSFNGLLCQLLHDYLVKKGYRQ